MLAKAVDVLVDPSLAHVVDLVAWSADGVLHVADSTGRASYAAGERVAVDGTDPIGDAEEYPYAVERLADLFTDPNAPDVAVVHTGGHYWPERGGHPGEHGSLNAEQSRAPLVLAGCGVTERGITEGARRMHEVQQLLVDLTERAPYVVGILWDGANCADVLALAADGTLPNVARLLERGHAYRGGAIAEFPSVTLVNHTSALTGVGPGGHGILHNVYLDRASGERRVANDITTWHRACDLLKPGVQTVFERLPHLATAAVNEPIDRGADYSTFGLVRDAAHHDGANSMVSQLPDPKLDPLATQRWVDVDKDYAFSSAVDALGLQQALQLWTGDELRPSLMWWNVIVTDSAHHGGGPRSDEARAGLADSDARLGVFLDLVDTLDLADRTAFLLTSDHGSQAADRNCRGDWDEALIAAGVQFRDEGYGFLYLS